MIEKIISDRLKCELTIQEKAAHADKAAQAHSEIGRIEENKKIAVLLFKNQTGEQERVRDYSSECVRTGVETRDVSVKVAYSLSEGIVRYWRLDTGELHEVRKMTPEEVRHIRAEEDALSLPFEDDDTEHQNNVLTLAPGRYEHEVEKEIASTYDSDPFAPDEAETSQRDPLEWRSLEDERPDPDTLVETGLYSEETEQVESCLMNGYVSADADVAWNKFTDFHTLPTDPGEPRFEEWDLTHWRNIQPDTDAPTEDGEAPEVDSDEYNFNAGDED